MTKILRNTQKYLERLRKTQKDLDKKIINLNLSIKKLLPKKGARVSQQSTE